MRETQWIEWARTRLQPQEREELLTALTSEQKAHLLEHDYVWVEGIGVLWNPADGHLLRRARFTHGTHFQTQRGDFYIDSEGSVCELSDYRIDPPMLSARPPSLAGEMERIDDFRGSESLDNAVPRHRRRVAPAGCLEHRTPRLLAQAPSSGGHRGRIKP